MRVFVTGATGFIGSAVVEKLQQQGHTVVAAHRGSRPVDWSELVVFETIADLSDISRDMLAGCDAVVHLAGIAHRGSVTDDEFDRVNHLATARLGELAVEAAVNKFVFMSTAKVYGERTTGTPFTASSPVNPPDAYSRSKVQAEEALRRLSEQSGLSVLIIRPPVVIGDGAKGNIAVLRKLLDRGIPIPVPRGGNRRSFVHLATIVDAVAGGLFVNATGAFESQTIADDAPNSTESLIDLLAHPAYNRTVQLPKVVLRLVARQIRFLASVDVSPIYQDFELRTDSELERLGS